MTNHRFSVGFLLLSLWLVPYFALAQAPFVFCDGTDVSEVTGSDGKIRVVQNNPCELNDLVGVPVRIFNFLLGMAGVVLLIVIIWAGVRMMLYHTSEMPEAELVAAKNTLRRGIFGFLIVAFSYVLVSLALSLLGLGSSSLVGSLLKGFGI